MATTITPANAALLFTISGLTGLKTADVSEALTISANTESYANTINVPTGSETLLIDQTMLDGAAGFDFDGLFVINKDDINFIRLRVSDTGAHTFDVKIPAGRFFLLWTTDINVSTTEGAFAAFTLIDKVEAQADTAAVDVQIVAFRI